MENLGIARRPRAPEISETLRTLGRPWKILGMVSGDIWAEARQRAGQEQTKGNIKEIQWSEGHWQNLGIASGKPWKNVGKTLGKPWKTLGNLGETVETLGRILETLGKLWNTLGKPWTRPAADFWMTAAACSRGDSSATGSGGSSSDRSGDCRSGAEATRHAATAPEHT
eukprot:gene13852-biopygen3991